MRCVFVAGASGRTGRNVVEALREAGIALIAGVRTAPSALGSAGGAARSLPPGTETIVCDLSAADAPNRLSRELLERGVTDVVCTVGFSPTFVPAEDRRLAEEVDYLATLHLIEASSAAKLPGRFVLVSSLGIDANSTSAKMLDSSLGNVLQQKRAAERALRASERLDWCIVRPGLLLKDKPQGGLVLGGAGRWVGEAQADAVPGLGAPVKCASPFLASSGAVCAATRSQVASVCVDALRQEAFSRTVVEVVAHPALPVQGPPMYI